MKIRYLKDGISEISEDVEVVARGCHSLYILVPCEQGVCLKAVPESLVVSKMFDSQDNPPYVKEFLENTDLTQIKRVDYSLTELFQAAH